MLMHRTGTQSSRSLAGRVAKTGLRQVINALHLPSAAATRAEMPDANPANGADTVAQLIVAVAQQDRAAYASLFGLFAPRVKAMLMRTGLDATAAEDIAQDCLLMVWRKAPMFNPAGASAPGWIYAIARNLRIDALRRQQRGQRLVTGMLREPSPDQKSQADVLADGDSDARVRMAMQALNPDQLRVVTLSFFEDRPHPEIAEALGIPLGTVKSRLRLAMNRLRDLLDDPS